MAGACTPIGAADVLIQRRSLVTLVAGTLLLPIADL